MAVSQFAEFLKKENINDIEILESENASTHTAQEAADVHGVPVGNIVKSLLTCIDVEGIEKFILVLVPGDKRLDLDYWQQKLGVTKIRMANAQEVKQVTGYSIGGVPPFGHISKIPTYLADGFSADSPLVAAAGSQNAVFKVSKSRLEELVK